jgi:hypothetical protein
MALVMPMWEGSNGKKIPPFLIGHFCQNESDSNEKSVFGI